MPLPTAQNHDASIESDPEPELDSDHGTDSSQDSSSSGSGSDAASDAESHPSCHRLSELSSSRKAVNGSDLEQQLYWSQAMELANECA